MLEMNDDGPLWMTVKQMDGRLSGESERERERRTVDKSADEMQKESS